MVKDFNAKLFDLTYTDFVEARLAIEENKFEEIKKFIVEASNGDAYLVIENKDFLYI